MSQGFFPAGIDTALNAIAALDELKLALLKAWPPAAASSTEQLSTVSPTVFGLDDHPALGPVELAEVDGVRCLRNVDAVVFGSAVVSTGARGWALLLGAAPIAWGPFVDVNGVEQGLFLIRAGDTVTIAAESLRIGLS